VCYVLVDLVLTVQNRMNESDSVILCHLEWPCGPVAMKLMKLAVFPEVVMYW